MTAELRIDQARYWALNNQPFYGSLAMKLSDVIDPATQTAATDGRVIRWNPDYVDTLTDPEVRFVLLHETLHNAHLHPWRLPADRRGNEAGDHAINLILQGIDGISMPEGGLADPQYKDLAEEEIYHRLGDEEPDDGQGGGESQGEQQQSGGDDSDGEDGEGSGGDQDQDGDGQGSSGAGSGQGEGGQPGGKPDPCGSFTAPAAEPDSNEAQEMRDDWETAVIQAAQTTQALGHGTVPGDMERLLEKMRHQTVDWRREMADFVRDAMSTRNDWSRPARRHAWQSVIYPRRRVDDLGTVIFARDTSGSVDDATCAQYSALISACVAEQGCEGLVIDCDRRIQSEYTVNSYEECPLTAKGGGGTDFRPVFARAEELVAQGQQLAGIVYLTDLLGPFPESTPEIATLWLVTSDHEAPFGRTVHIDLV